MFKKKISLGAIILWVCGFLLFAGFVPLQTTLVRKYIGMMKNAAITQDDLTLLKGTDGVKWFVDGSLSASGAGEFAGKTWALAYKTLTEANSAASAGDLIYVAPSTYTDSLRITTNRLSFIAAVPHVSGYVKGSVILDNGSNVNANGYAVPNMVILADNVSIQGFTFTSDSAYSLLKLGSIADNVGACDFVKIIDCYFSGTVGTYGIIFEPDSVDFALVEGCGFTDLATAAIQLIGDNCVILKNHFTIAAGTIGLEYTSTTTTNTNNRISWNTFIGSASTDTGIKVTNTPGAGLYFIDHNIVANCNTPITSKANNDAVTIINYVGDASGGALMNPSA